MVFIILLLQVVAFFVEWLFMLPVILLSYRVKRTQHMSRLPANPIFYQTNVLAPSEPTLNYQPSMGRHNAFAG